MDVHPPAQPPAELLSRCRRGDPRALAELVQRERRELLRSVQALTHRGILGRMEPEDVFQETVLQAMKSSRSLRAHDLPAFRAWFRAIARHRLFHLRRRDRVRERPRHATPLPDSLLAYLDPQALEGEERTGEAIAEDRPTPFPGLHADRRLAFVLRRVLEAEWGTVAFLLDRGSIDAVRLLMLRAQVELDRHCELDRDCGAERPQSVRKNRGARGSRARPIPRC